LCKTYLLHHHTTVSITLQYRSLIDAIEAQADLT
jgi:hypothetical protein